MNLKYFWLLIAIITGGIGFFIIKPIIKKHFQKNIHFNIGICCGEPPYEYLNKEGQVEGLIKDLMNDAFNHPKLKNYKFQFSILPFNQSFISLNREKIDFLSTLLQISEERKKLYNFAVINKTHLYFIYRTNTNVGDIYGLQTDSYFESLAKKNSIKYIGYDKLQDVLLNFSIKKINGFACDSQLLKSLLDKNYNDITTYKPIAIENYDNYIILINPNVKDDICGVLNHNTPMKNEEIRLYHSLKDLILAFRCSEIKTMIVLKKNIDENFNKLMDLKIQNNSKNFNFKPFLPIKYLDNYWMIEKPNNSQNLVVGTIKHHIINTFKNMKIYQDNDILFNELMNDKIDGILIKDFNELSLNFYIGFANINTSVKNNIMENGFAFRKNNQTDFDIKYQQTFIEVIEETAKKNPNLFEYIVIYSSKNDNINK